MTTDQVAQLKHQLLSQALGALSGLLPFLTRLLMGVVMGVILAPRIFSQAVGVHPIVAIFALFAGAELFGLLEGGSLSLWLACSSSSSWRSGSGGKMRTPNSSRQKNSLLRTSFTPFPTLFFTCSAYAVKVRERCITEQALFHV